MSGQICLVNVAPFPVRTRERLDNGVAGVMKMFRGVLILRTVTAADMPTNETQAQFHPLVTGLQAVLAAVSTGLDCPYLVQMFAFLRWHNSTPGKTEFSGAGLSFRPFGSATISKPTYFRPRQA